MFSQFIRDPSTMLSTILLAFGEPHPVVVQTGIGLGSVIAVVCSWDRNRSILWAILAGIFTWFYVIYFAITREDGPPPVRS
jgi:hypothetical protein